MFSTGSRHIKRRMLGIITAAAVAATALVACSGDMSGVQPDDNETRTGMMTISFRVATPATETSRAEDTGNYEDGKGLESTIDFDSKSFRIYFFDTNKRIITEWKDPVKTQELTGVHYSLYTFTGNVPEIVKFHKHFYVMVMANWPDYPDLQNINLSGKTINDIVTAEWAKFAAFDSFELSVEDGRLIPLYGLASFKDKTFARDETCDLGEINLLRAMAKVEVNIEELPEGITLTKAPVIHGINSKGFCAPLGEFGSGDNWDTDYVTAVHLPSGDYNDTDAMEREMAMLAAGENKWIAYLPEFRNIGVGDDFSRIELTFSHLKEPFVLNFAKYDDSGYPDNVNGRYDIRRNDLYRFNVRSTLHTIQVDLRPYSSVELKPSFGLDYPEG